MGREGCRWPGGGAVTWAEVAGGLVAQFCHHKVPEEHGQDLQWTPLPPIPYEGLEQALLTEGGKNAFLRLCKARLYQGHQHCHDKNCDFLVLSIVFSTPAVEGGGGTSLSQQLCLHRAVPRHGTGCHGSDMGKSKVPRAEDRLALK